MASVFPAITFRLMDFDQIMAVTRLEEHRLATAVADLAEHSEPFAGGVMARGAPGTWVNACYGAGLDGGVDSAAVERLCAFYERASLEPRIELAPFVEPGALALLAERNFVVRGFDNILARSLDTVDLVSPLALPDLVTIEIVDSTDPAQVDECARVAMSGFAAATSSAAEASLDSMRQAIRLPRTTAIVARVKGRVVAAAALEIVGAVACLFGASVLPELRRRGIHRSLLQARLREAARRGAEFATIGSRPGTSTERNVRRLGFELIYMRTAFVRPGRGLVGVVE